MTLFGVACQQQMDSSELHDADDAVTRNTVLKSLVAVMVLPLFGLAESHLQTCMAALFAQRDFRDTSILAECCASFSRALLARALDDECLFAGLSPRPLLRRLGRRALQLFKLLLLGRRSDGHEQSRWSPLQCAGARPGRRTCRLRRRADTGLHRGGVAWC